MSGRCRDWECTLAKEKRMARKKRGRFFITAGFFANIIKFPKHLCSKNAVQNKNSQFTFTTCITDQNQKKLAEFGKLFLEILCAISKGIA
jgi:hypothetical protein